MLGFCLLLLGMGAAQAADPTKGGQIYITHCVACHGSKGTGVMPDAPNFAQGDSLMQSDYALLTSIKNGKNAMPAFIGTLSDTDILDVIVYIRTLY